MDRQEYRGRVEETALVDLPLGYFIHNMYEEEELSIENLLPSLRPEDFAISSAQQHVAYSNSSSSGNFTHANDHNMYHVPTYQNL